MELFKNLYVTIWECNCLLFAAVRMTAIMQYDILLLLVPRRKERVNCVECSISLLVWHCLPGVTRTASCCSFKFHLFMWSLSKRVLLRWRKWTYGGVANREPLLQLTTAAPQVESACCFFSITVLVLYNMQAITITSSPTWYYCYQTSLYNKSKNKFFCFMGTPPSITQKIMYGIHFNCYLLLY